MVIEIENTDSEQLIHCLGSTQDETLQTTAEVLKIVDTTRWLRTEGLAVRRIGWRATIVLAKKPKSGRK